MRILIVSTHSSRGGAGIAAKAFANGLKTLGHEVKMLVQRIDSKDDVDAIKIDEHKRVSHFKSFLDTKLPTVLCGSDFTFSCGIVGTNVISRIREFNPDIVIIHWINKGFLSWKNISDISENYPTIIHMHDWWYSLNGEHIDSSYFTERKGVWKFMRNFLNKLVISKSRQVRDNRKIRYVSPSDFMRSEAIKGGLIDKNSVVVVNNFLQLNKDYLVTKSDARKSLSLDKDKKYILISSVNINKDVVKGGVYLKAIFAELFKTGQYSNCGVISFGSEDPFPILKLPDNVETLHLGWVSKKQAMAAFAAADVHCITSLVESFSLTTLESLYAGTPVLGFKTGALPELIVDDYNGNLIEPFNVNLYVSTLKSILDKGVKLSSTEISQLAKERFNEMKSINEYDKLIREHLRNVTL